MLFSNKFLYQQTKNIIIMSHDVMYFGVCGFVLCGVVDVNNHLQSAICNVNSKVLHCRFTIHCTRQDESANCDSTVGDDWCYENVQCFLFE
jgi:hypothetical protein